jgi:hypothetical protein
VYQLAILTATILSTGLTGAASADIVIFVKISRSFLATELTTLLATSMLATLLPDLTTTTW